MALLKGDEMVACCVGTTLYIVDITEGKIVSKYRYEDDEFYAVDTTWLQWLGGGTCLVVTGGKAGIVHVLHPKTGTCLERLYGHSGSVHAVQFAPSAADDRGCIRAWVLSSPGDSDQITRCVKAIHLPDAVTCLYPLTAWRCLAGTRQGQVYWIALAGIPGPYQAITKLISAYHDQPSPVRRIVPVGTGQVAILHEQESLVHVLNRHNHDMNDDATDTDYQLQSRIVTDEPLTGTCIQHTEHFTTLVGCTRSSLVFYDLRTAKPDPKTLAHTQPITNLTLSHSGSTIVTASPNNISVWTL